MPKWPPRANAGISFLISATGGDSALALYDQLPLSRRRSSSIMTIKAGRVCSRSWRDHRPEKQAAARIIAEFAQPTTPNSESPLPPQPAARRYTLPHSANLWTPESAQALLTQCHRFYAGDIAPEGCKPAKAGKRHDIIQLGGENLAAGLNGESFSCLPATTTMLRPFTPIRCWRTLPAVQNKRVYAPGTENVPSGLLQRNIVA